LEVISFVIGGHWQVQTSKYFYSITSKTPLTKNFFHRVSSTDEDNLLDVSVEIIEETLVKKKPDSPRSYAEDVVRCLGIITPELGRVDAANQSFLNTIMHCFYYTTQGMFETV